MALTAKHRTEIFFALIASSIAFAIINRKRKNHNSHTETPIVKVFNLTSLIPSLGSM